MLMRLYDRPSRTARSACRAPSSDLHAHHGAVSTARVWDARVFGATAGEAASKRVRAPSAHAGVSREAAAVEGSGRRGGGRALAAKVSPNPAAGLAEILHRPTAWVALVPLWPGQRSIGLSLLVVDTPIGVRQHVRVCPVEPQLGAAQVQDRETRAPLGDEDGAPAVHCGLRSVPQLSIMDLGIEVERVNQVRP